MEKDLRVWNFKGKKDSSPDDGKIKYLMSNYLPDCAEKSF